MPDFTTIKPFNFLMVHRSPVIICLLCLSPKESLVPLVDYVIIQYIRQDQFNLIVRYTGLSACVFSKNIIKISQPEKRLIIRF